MRNQYGNNRGKISNHSEMIKNREIMGKQYGNKSEIVGKQ
jgi:hypothetical protein